MATRDRRSLAIESTSGCSDLRLELDAEKADAYDAVITGLCSSALSNPELAFNLEQVMRILRRGHIGQLA